MGNLCSAHLCNRKKYLVSIAECEYNPSLIVDALKLIITVLCLTFGCYKFESMLENSKESNCGRKRKNIWNIILKLLKTKSCTLPQNFTLFITQTSGSFFEAAYNKFKTYNTITSYNGTEEFLCGKHLKECLKKWCQEAGINLRFPASIQWPLLSW